MKGFIIYEDFITNVKSVVNCGRLSPSCYTCRLGTNNLPEASVSGGLLETTTAICKGNDKYDFEVGALIALMKMCGVDKVVRACNEAFSEDTFKTYAIKYERELNELKKEKHRLEEEYIKLREEEMSVCFGGRGCGKQHKALVELFKKGRLAVKVTYENYKEFYEACEKELGKKPATMYCGDFTVSICKKDGNFEIFTMEDQKKTGRKIVNWEDVR